VIMTDNKSKPMYERMASRGLEPVKSQLLSRLNEVLNTEISQRVIADSVSALNWIKHTLFFVQFNKDPTAYNVEPSVSAVDAHLVQLCSEAIRQLRSIGVLVQREDTAVLPRDASHIMSQHLVDYPTMEIISQLPFDATQCQVARAISHIKNLQRPCRRNEKKTLNAVHKEIKFKLDGQPSKVRVQQPWEKSFVLLQSHIGQVTIEDYTLRQETMSMVEYASRVLVAAEEFSARSSRHGKVVVETLKLRRALATRVWCSQSGVLGQFSSLDRKTVSALKFNGISTFDDVLATNEETLEAVAKRTKPFGLDLRKVVSQVLASTLKLTAEIEYSAGSRTPVALVCHLSVRDDIPNLVKDLAGSANTPPVTYTLIAYTDRPGGCLMYKKNVSKANTFKVVCPQRFGKVSVHLVASMIGLDGKFPDSSHAKCPSDSERFLTPFYNTLSRKSRACR
jgi:ATP-dependent DNA helicase HFM1/MER3